MFWPWDAVACLSFRKGKWHQLKSRTEKDEKNRDQCKGARGRYWAKNTLSFKKRNVMHTDFIYFVQIILWLILSFWTGSCSTVLPKGLWTQNSHWRAAGNGAACTWGWRCRVGAWKQCGLCAVHQGHQRCWQLLPLALAWHLGWSADLLL